MSLFAMIVSEDGEIDLDVLRQVAHEHLAGTLSEEDEGELDPIIDGRELNLGGIDGDVQSSYELEEIATEVVELINADYSLSRVSGIDLIVAYTFGFDAWYWYSYDAADESYSEYVTGVSDPEALFRNLQVDWIRAGTWTGTALTDLSARNLDAPWFLRELAGFTTNWGAETQHYDNATVEFGAAIPQQLIEAAITHWNHAVRVFPDGADEVQFGHWQPESPEFTEWLAGKHLYWLDTEEPLSLSDASGLRHACLRLGMVETHMYA